MTTRDIRQLVQQVRSGEPVVREDGSIETGREAVRNAEREEEETGQAVPRMRVKKTTFGGAGGCAPRDQHRVEEGVLRRFPELAAMFPGVETGAVGVGPDLFTLSELIPSGPTADRAPGSFGLDPEFLNPLLGRARRRWLRFNCVWHVHPPDCDEPSTTDRQAARELLNDPDTGLEGSLLLPISTRTATGVTTRFFVAEGKNADIRPTSPALISRTSSEADPLPGDRTWGVAFLDALFAARCEQRIHAILESLRAHHFTVERRDGSDGTRVIRTDRNGVVLWFALPNEFPASPPRVFADDGAELCEVSARDMPSLVGWSSLSEVVTLAIEAEAAVLTWREAASFILRPRSVELVSRVSPRALRLAH